MRSVERGIDRTTGGSFEGEFLALNLFGDDGLLVRTEMFDADGEVIA